MNINKIKQLSLILITIACVLLTACAAVTRKIQDLGNSPNQNYPAAEVDPALEKPAFVNLSAYKSVHSRPHNNQQMAIALAASGGGYRAANLTLGTMMGLEKMKLPKQGNLLEEVDYYSSVSGGGFGVGYYLTQLHNHLMQSPHTPFSLSQHVEYMLAYDQNMLTNNTLSSNPLCMDLTEFLFFGKNRGFELEKRLSHTVFKTRKGTLTLGDIFIPKGSAAQVQLPYWATNSTIYQNAGSFPFAPDVLDTHRVTGYFHDNREYRSNGSPNFSYSMPVSVGATASASVPFAIPPTTLISNSSREPCYLQLLDGGLADNLGIYTALSFLLQDKSKIKVLIIVDASKSTTKPFSRLKTPPENMALFWRVVTASTDANRERIKPNIHLLASELLCGTGGASNVIVVYLDLSQYPEAQRIPTQLSISHYDQQLLLKIGQELVATDPTLKKLVKEINEGKLTLGQCRKI